MKTRILTSLTVLLGAGLLLAGCSKNASDSSSATDTSAAAAAPASDSTVDASGIKTYTINAGDNMKFSVTQLDAKPGETIKVVLNNTGTQPKSAMGHNWVLLDKGADVAAFDSAAAQAKATDYFPADKASEVIAHTKLLGAHESDTVTFKAPSTPGDYPYLCTFPAHYQVGMKGVLTVK